VTAPSQRSSRCSRRTRRTSRVSSLEPGLIEQGKARTRSSTSSGARRRFELEQAFRLLGRVKGEVGDTAGAVAAYQHAIVA